MSAKEKLFLKIMTGSVHSISFDELVKLLLSIGFEMRIKGSHQIFYHQDIDEIINIQPKSGMAKPYQVRQVRNIISKYELRTK